MYTKAAAHVVEVSMFDAIGEPIITGTPTVELSKDSAAYAATTNALGHVDEELWTITLTATEANCDRYRLRVMHTSLLATKIISDKAETAASATALALIKAKTDLITSANITVTAAVKTDGDIELVQYDDYLAANSRALSWTNTSGDWFAGDLTTATVALTIVDNDGVLVLTKAGTVTTATGTQAVAVELTSANTALLTKQGKQYKYQLLLTKTAYRETEVTGDITVTLTNKVPT